MRGGNGEKRLKDDFWARGIKPLGPRIEEITTMDIIGELLAIDRCLRSPAFRPGDMVQSASGGGDGRAGTVIAFRLLITEHGIGNEYEVRWDDGQINWVDGRSLTPFVAIGGRLPCASTTSCSIT